MPRRAFPDAGWEIRDRNDAAPGIRRFVEQVTMFLTLVGLTALGVGGVGAGQAVTRLPRPQARRHRHPEIAGRGRQADVSDLLPAGDGDRAGRPAAGCGHRRHPALPAGLFLWRCPAAAAELWASIPAPLLLAAGFGLLSAIAFSVPPLGRAREIPPASLFRETWRRSRARPRPAYLAGRRRRRGLGIAGLTLLLAPSPLYAGEFLGGAIAAAGAAAAAGRRSDARLLRRLPRPRSPLLRLALANLTRPGAATRRRGHRAGPRA